MLAANLLECAQRGGRRRVRGVRGGSSPWLRFRWLADAAVDAPDEDDDGPQEFWAKIFIALFGLLFVVVAIVAVVVLQFSCNLHLFIFAFINKQHERVVVVINIAHTQRHTHRQRRRQRKRLWDCETRDLWEWGDLWRGEGEREAGRLGDRQETCTNIFIFSQFSTLVDKTVNKMQCKA